MPRAQKAAPKRPKRTADASTPTGGHRVGGKRPPSRESGKVGRPTKFTPEVRERILEALRRGAYRAHAVAHARIGYSAFNEWLNQGEADAKENKATLFAQFAQDVKEAEAKAVVFRLARIEKAGVKFWQADAWLLERRYPHLYGRRVVDGREMTPAEARRLLAEELGVSEDALAAPSPGDSGT